MRSCEPAQCLHVAGLVLAVTCPLLTTALKQQCNQFLWVIRSSATVSVYRRQLWMYCQSKQLLKQKGTWKASGESIRSDTVFPLDSNCWDCEELTFGDFQFLEQNPAFLFTLLRSLRPVHRTWRWWLRKTPVLYQSNFKTVFHSGINLLMTKRNVLYIRNQSVPRSKHFPPLL